MNKAERDEMIELTKSQIRVREEQEERGGYDRLSSDGKEALRRDKEYLHDLTTPPEVRIKELEERIGVGFGFSSSVLAGLKARLASAKKEISGKSSETAAQTPSLTTRPVVMPSGIRGVQQQGLHTPTMAEIIANANKSRSTEIVFDANSDHMAQIDPLATHYDLSGDFPRLVNPLKPGPKMPTNG